MTSWWAGVGWGFAAGILVASALWRFTAFRAIRRLQADIDREFRTRLGSRTP